MIDGLTITPKYGDPITLSLPGGGGGYLVRNIEGLDPVPVTISSAPLALIDREIHQYSRKEKRTITITIKLDQNFGDTSIESRRKRLYSLAADKELVNLTFSTTDLGVVEIDGYVEDMESNIFTDEPLVSISILCLDSDFRSKREDKVEGLVGEGPVIFDYNGTAPAGVLVTLLPNPGPSNANNVALDMTHLGAGDRIGYILNDSTMPVDDLGWLYSSIPGRRYIQRYPTPRPWFGSVRHNSIVWPTLYRGQIEFAIDGPSGRNWLYEVTWHNRYGAL